MDKKLWLNIKNFNSIFETSLNLDKECFRCYLKLPSMKLAIYVRRSRNTSCLFQYHWKSILWQYMFVAINVSQKHLLPQISFMINVLPKTSDMFNVLHLGNCRSDRECKAIIATILPLHNCNASGIWLRCFKPIFPDSKVLDWILKLLSSSR